MRPILLHGHERAVTVVRYNYEGDLLFTASMDGKVYVWHSETGDRIGSYEETERDSTVWDLAVSRDSSLLLTASGDFCVRLWQVETGTLLKHVILRAPAKGIAWADGDKQFLVVTAGGIQIFDFATFEPVNVITADEFGSGGGFTQAKWLPLNEGVIAGFADGWVRTFNFELGKWVTAARAHTRAVSSLSYNKHQSFVLSTSVDGSAKLWNVADMAFLREYKSDTDVNAGAISPIKRHVILGGGPAAIDVAKQDSGPGKFDSKFFDLVTGEEFGRVSGHFGPIQSIAIHPDGLSYATGGFDGIVRLQTFDPSYLKEESPEDPELEKALGEMSAQEVADMMAEDGVVEEEDEDDVEQDWGRGEGYGGDEGYDEGEYDEEEGYGREEEEA